MSDEARSVSEAMERLKQCDLKSIELNDKQHTDAELAELADCLLAHPDVVTHANLAHNRMTDATGIKLARYLAASSTILRLNLAHNQLGSATRLAVAAALRVNTSLRDLFLFDNQAVDRTRIEAAFVDALRLNPDRPADSVWYLYSYSFDYERLQDAADKLGHPSLQLLLAARLERDDRPTCTIRH